MRVPYKSFCALVILLFAASSLAFAQTIAAHSYEIAGTFGQDGHFIYGGSGAYNFSNVIAGGFQYKYIPQGSDYTGSEILQTFGGFARFSSGTSFTTIPYILVGGGGLNYVGITLSQGGPPWVRASQSGWYVLFGGGVTILPRRHWGIRPEASLGRKHYIGNSDYWSHGQYDIQVVVSGFYQFGGLPKKP